MPIVLKCSKWNYGIPDRLISAIGLIHEGTQARVIKPDGATEFFSILA